MAKYPQGAASSLGGHVAFPWSFYGRQHLACVMSLGHGRFDLVLDTLFFRSLDCYTFDSDIYRSFFLIFEKALGKKCFGLNRGGGRGN
jgi:hypothetical protein